MITVILVIYLIGYVWYLGACTLSADPEDCFFVFLISMVTGILWFVPVSLILIDYKKGE